MSAVKLCFVWLAILLFGLKGLNAQIDTTTIDDEEDYSQYETVESSGEVKLYCNPKILDLSPNRFISVSYDYIVPHNLSSSVIGTYSEGDQVQKTESQIATHGLRINANIPVISLSNWLWQIGGGFVHSYYQGSETARPDSLALLYNTLNEQGLKNYNLNSTVFRPLNENSFIIFQGMLELNGSFSYTGANSPDFNNLRSSATLLYGKRPHDRLQWAVGLSRTYRAGELNYIPVIMYNYTAANRKWGTEILFPARAAYRRKFNSRSILLAGYELEGSSYRIYRSGYNDQNLELRRSELRFRLDYQKQLKGFVWIGIQAGLRYNYLFHLDSLSPDNREFFRGFFGTQPYAMLNDLQSAPYFNVSLNLVSP